MTFAPAVQEWDFMILDWIQANLKTGWLDRLMPIITSLGTVPVIWILPALLFLFWKPLQTYRRCGAALLGGLAAGSLVCTLIMKNVFRRARPCWIDTAFPMLIKIPKDYSFPSGHTLMGFISAVVLLHYDKRLGVPALILAILIAFSRMYLYVHFPTDVLGGMFFGILFGILACRVADRYVKDPEESGSEL